MFVVPAREGCSLDDLLHHVTENHVGGVIWFQSTTVETARVNELLQAQARVPLLVSADLESGMGMRFTDGDWWPPAMAVAAAGDPSLAEEMGRVTAREALAIGVNHILAPVADVNVNPANPVINTRSFGEDPHDVARYVAAFVRGVQEGGCLATAKHFPGHGDTHVDSHRSLPVLEVTRDRLEEVELVPFRAAIDAGVAAIMVGHLAIPSLDATPAPVRPSFENTYGTHQHEVPASGTMPATLSRAVIVELLRRDLGFEGLVLTDAMDMGGLAAHFDPGEAAVRAIEAGEDQILFSPDTDAAVAAVKGAVIGGRITEARIDESVKRILAAKSRLAAAKPKSAPESHAMREIARRAVRVVRDREGLLPLRHPFTAVVVSDLPEENPLPECVRDLGADRVLHVDSTAETVGASSGTVVLLLALRPKSGAGRIAIPHVVRDLVEQRGAEVVAVSFGSPYVQQELGEASTYIEAWGIQPVLQYAVMSLLLDHRHVRHPS